MIKRIRRKKYFVVGCIACENIQVCEVAKGRKDFFCCLECGKQFKIKRKGTTNTIPKIYGETDNPTEARDICKKVI